ncbi:MAG: AI-2E family transporter, partial [Dehalococcoidia bacterium]|nr:AI-2E family transporter [Dehalococcoidia bacterium]
MTYRTKIVIVSIIVILFLVLLVAVRSILTPFIWGAVIAYLLTPVVNWLSRRTRLPRFSVLAGLYLVFGAGMLWALYFLVPFLIREAGDFRSSIPLIIGSLQEEVLGSETINFLGITLDPQNISASILRTLGASPMGAVTIVRETATFIAEIILFLAVTFYLTSDAPRIREGFFQLFPAKYRPEAIAVFGRINRVLGAYIRGQFILIALMSTVTWIFLGLVLKVKFALFLSLITGVLEIIPFVGPITAGAIATSVALFQPNEFGWPAWGLALAVVAVYFVLRHAEDYLVIPNVIGRIVELHPVVVIFAVLAGV